jgi:hypothetical protein
MCSSAGYEKVTVLDSQSPPVYSFGEYSHRARWPTETFLFPPGSHFPRASAFLYPFHGLGPALLSETRWVALFSGVLERCFRTTLRP